MVNDVVTGREGNRGGEWGQVGSESASHATWLKGDGGRPEGRRHGPGGGWRCKRYRPLLDPLAEGADASDDYDFCIHFPSASLSHSPGLAWSKLRRAFNWATWSGVEPSFSASNL